MVSLLGRSGSFDIVSETSHTALHRTAPPSFELGTLGPRCPSILHLRDRTQSDLPTGGRVRITRPFRVGPPGYRPRQSVMTLHRESGQFVDFLDLKVKAARGGLASSHPERAFGPY